MEPQDNIAFSAEPKKPGLAWKITAICGITLALGAGAWATFLTINQNDCKNDLSAVQEQLDTAKADLADQQDTKQATPEIDLTETLTGINTAIDNRVGGEFAVSLEGAYVKTNNGYEIAHFLVSDDLENGTGFAAFLYRILPTGTWKISEFSGHAIPGCSDVNEDEVAAFDGILECTK